MSTNEKITIMHIAQAAGGVDKYLQMLLKYIDKQKYKNILICSFDYNPEDYKGLADVFEQIEMQHSIGLSDLKNAIKLRKLIKKYAPDIVYSHSSKAGAITRMANIGIKNKSVYNPHGWAFNIRCSKIRQNTYVALEKLMALFCDKIICISNAEKNSALNKKICKENKTQVILNGIDFEKYDMKKHNYVSLTRHQLAIPENAFIVGMVGRLENQKAPDIFMKTARIIKDLIPQSFFILVGNGNQEEKVLQYAKEYLLNDSLLITGWVNNPDSYIDLFDVAMLLSRWEGFGLVLAEYMMMRKPIVATNVDAIPEIINDHKNGLLVQVDDYESAAKSVVDLYNNPELKMKLVEQGYHDVYKRFDVKRVADEHNDFFQKLITDR